ncbi:hypothetical protein EJB05_52346 [Eragrostis curvula]|uniref:Uncharacterized protein n=1 Tax=Eragrostis curvula TaxID=38414 RepID=A0A5J9ST96_9POAL|nr:hypothetical protein EJB05_52346 [Eragrostis curvula]
MSLQVAAAIHCGGFLSPSIHCLDPKVVSRPLPRCIRVLFVLHSTSPAATDSSLPPRLWIVPTSMGLLAISGSRFWRYAYRKDWVLLLDVLLLV